MQMTMHRIDDGCLQQYFCSSVPAALTAQNRRDDIRHSMHRKKYSAAAACSKRPSATND
jgi:hypothetical protein